MGKLEVGSEVELANRDGRYKVVEIKGKVVKVKFGLAISMEVKLADIVKIYAKKGPVLMPVDKSQKYFSFNSTLDLHGMSLEEGAQILEEWLDEGLRAGCKYFKIVHGKGEGILRKRVRAVLQRKKLIKCCYDSEEGGATIVEI